MNAKIKYDKTGNWSSFSLHLNQCET